MRDSRASASADYGGSNTDLLNSDLALKMPAAATYCEYHVKKEDNSLDAYELVNFLTKCGFLRDDARFEKLYAKLLPAERSNCVSKISLEEVASILLEEADFMLLERAFRGTLTVPDFPTFCTKVEEIFKSVLQDITPAMGKNANYIAPLEKVDGNKFGLAICTIDGQRYTIGDAFTPFSVQSCIKPLTYCLAIEEFGEEKVHLHLGREPSGVAFNSLTLNNKNIPHNPMINAGAIMACSLIKPRLTLSERFEYVSQQMKKISGGIPWGFSNSVYQSEKATADSNFCLGYMMQGKKVFPEGTNLKDTLDFYFQCCSLETDCNRLAIAGATLANMGVCPITNEKIFHTKTCRNALSLMYSCGMVQVY
jgi:glutaminase